ncbi:MAG: hypothetical protein JW712_08590, partial [Dehalococcoidales bacterium]|nr:hypothetical protein [Dehalococcoidales bacterium]
VQEKITIRSNMTEIQVDHSSIQTGAELKGLTSHATYTGYLSSYNTLTSYLAVVLDNPDVNYIIPDIAAYYALWETYWTKRNDIEELIRVTAVDAATVGGITPSALSYAQQIAANKAGWRYQADDYLKYSAADGELGDATAGGAPNWSVGYNGWIVGNIGTELSFTFPPIDPLYNAAYRIELLVYDQDTANINSITVNGTHIGYIETTGNNILKTQVYSVPETVLSAETENVIKIHNATGTSDPIYLVSVQMYIDRTKNLYHMYRFETIQGPVSTYGSSTQTSIDMVGPLGMVGKAWYLKALSGGTSWAGGIWYTHGPKIDPLKHYRISYWFKQSGAESSIDGRLYFGLDMNSRFVKLTGTSLETSPYFFSEYAYKLNSTKWYLLVGNVYPYNTPQQASMPATDSGLYEYDPTFGTLKKIASSFAGDYRFADSTVDILRPRTAIYANTDTDQKDFYWMFPRIDLIDGSEANIFAPFGRIYTATDRTVIDGGVITTGKILSGDTSTGFEIDMDTGNMKMYGAEFTGTIYAGTIMGNTALPASPAFTDTTYTKADIDAMNVDAGTVDGKTVGVSVPSNAVFSDTGGGFAAQIGFNPMFNSWAGTYPDGWSVWVSSYGVAKVSGDLSANAVSIATAGGGDHGLSRTITLAEALPEDTVFTFSVRYKYSQYTSGYGGILFRYYNAAGTVYKEEKINLPNSSSWTTKTIISTQAKDLGSVGKIYVYLMGAWSTTFPTGTNTLVIDGFDIQVSSARTDSSIQSVVNANENFSIDFVTGKVVMKDGEFSGYLKSSGGTFGSIRQDLIDGTKRTWAVGTSVATIISTVQSILSGYSGGLPVDNNRWMVSGTHQDHPVFAIEVVSGTRINLRYADTNSIYGTQATSLTHSLTIEKIFSDSLSTYTRAREVLPEPGVSSSLGVLEEPFAYAHIGYIYTPRIYKKSGATAQIGSASEPFDFGYFGSTLTKNGKAVTTENWVAKTTGNRVTSITNSWGTGIYLVSWYYDGSSNKMYGII